MSVITLATWLTLTRIILVVPVVILILLSQHLAAMTVLAVGAVTDFLDGHVARSRGEVSAIGTALDPIADKILVVGALFGLSAASLVGGIHLIPILAIVMREVLISGLREAAGDSVSLPVSGLAKVKTTAQFVAIGCILLWPGWIGLSVLWIAAGLTVLTGADYVRLWVQSTLK